MSKLKFLDKWGRPFFSNRLLISSLSLAGIFALGFPYPVFESIGKLGFLILISAVILDIYFLYLTKYQIDVAREINEKLSNGEENEIHYTVKGQFSFRANISIIDEFPVQLQLRNVSLPVLINEKQFETKLNYVISPKSRGKYHFGKIKLLIRSPFSLIQKLHSLHKEQTVRVYPSIIQYKRFSFLAHTNRLEEAGVKKVRKVGSSTEFVQIKEFQNGDEFKRINWKATAKAERIMVNHYEDEKAQNIYFIIDKGRLMHMPFDGLSLFDYAINSSLALSGVAKENGDKVGLITFSDIIGSWIPAKSKSAHINTINDALYHQKIRLKESDYSRLYRNIRTKIRERSIMILFTNFDSVVSLRRQLKYIKALSSHHVLIMVSFKNEEIKQLASQQVKSEGAYFDQSIAEKFLLEKQQIVNELNQSGVYTILSSPKDLTVNSINKYLEIKSRGLL